MGQSFRLVVHRTGVALIAAAGTCAITSQAANLTLSALSFSLSAGAGSVPITSKNATLSLTDVSTPQKWATRSNQPGVTYKQDFTVPGAVTPYFFDNGQGEVAAGLITVDTTDGTETANCLKIRTPAGWGDGINPFPQAAVFRHPLNSAWTLNSQSFGSAPVWFSWRMKVNAGRLVPSTPGLGWKFFNLAQFSINDGGASGQSNITAEIVGQDTLARGFPSAYHQDGSGFPPFETTAGQGPGGDINFENALDNGVGSTHRYCLYGDHAGCWQWPVDQWFSMKVRMQPGTYGGSTNNQFDMWAALDGATSWTHLMAWGDNVSLPFTLGTPQSGYSGYNGIHWHIYETGRISSTQDAIVKYDEIIVSTADIAVPTSSVLSTLTRSLSPGQWGQLTVANQNALLGIGLTNQSMLPQTNKVNWCSQTRTIELVAEDHGGDPTTGWGIRHVKYDEATNTFILVERTSGLYTFGHCYDHCSINPYTGDLYLRNYFAGAGNLVVFNKPLANRSVWRTDVPNYNDGSQFQQVAIGTCWWSGSFVGAGAQGCLMVFNSGAANSPPGAATDGQIMAYDPLANSWFYDHLSRAPFYGAGGTGTYHTVMAYSAVKNVAVYGGGNNAPQQLWKMDSTGTVTAMATVPTGLTVGVGVGTNAGRIVADPVTGKFLLLDQGQLWVLDPTGSGTWAQETRTAVPATVGNPDATEWVASCALPDHGCVAFIKQNNATTGTFWVYKHA